jgi:hypothetical protein
LPEHHAFVWRVIVLSLFNSSAVAALNTSLFERFKRTKATLNWIISSGYSNEIVKLRGLIDPGITFLPKP